MMLLANYGFSLIKLLFTYICKDLYNELIG
jgi:hypothetical protein